MFETTIQLIKDKDEVYHKLIKELIHLIDKTEGKIPGDMIVTLIENSIDEMALVIDKYKQSGKI